MSDSIRTWVYLTVEHIGAGLYIEVSDHIIGPMSPDGSQCKRHRVYGTVIALMQTDGKAEPTMKAIWYNKRLVDIEDAIVGAADHIIGKCPAGREGDFACFGCQYSKDLLCDYPHKVVANG